MFTEESCQSLRAESTCICPPLLSFVLGEPQVEFFLLTHQSPNTFDRTPGSEVERRGGGEDECFFPIRGARRLPLSLSLGKRATTKRLISGCQALDLKEELERVGSELRKFGCKTDGVYRTDSS